MLLPLAAEGLIIVLGHESDSGRVGFLGRFLNHEYDQAAINLSLLIVAGAILAAIVLSLIYPPQPETNESAIDEG
jgi:hypothetical protein